VQSLPDIKTTLTFDPGNTFDIRSPLVEAHQFNKLSWLESRISGTQMIGSYLQMYYNEPKDNESFLYLSQVFQSDALKFAMENFRIKKPSCMGSIFWHFNDCWPSISWSVIDFYGRNKPAYFAVKKAYENIVVVPEKQHGCKIWVVNDSLSVLNCEISVMVMDFNGNQIFNFNQEITVESNASKQVFEKDFVQLFPLKQSNKVLLYTWLTKNGKKIADNILYFVDPLYLDLPEPDINMQVINNGTRFQLLFRSNNLAKNLVLYTLNKECEFSDNNFDLLPGFLYSVTVEYEGSEAEFENDLQVMTLGDSF
jgi:beta-mannosidase